MEPIPRRPFGSALPKGKNDKLAKEVSILGLGCSSFSSFFDAESSAIDLATLDKSDPIVQGWIQTIHFAVLEAGINLLDTAPWYGHGTSEVVVGWAMQGLLEEITMQPPEDDGAVVVTANSKIPRNHVILNTKVGRYEANPKEQFDFSRAMTLQSAQRSVGRMQCGYIDVLQLHDPEFAPSLEILLEETIPAMMECREKGWCRALGLTGFPLSVQYQILQASIAKFGTNVWDQALTYGHFNLHDSSLLYQSMAVTNTANVGSKSSSSSSSNDTETDTDSSSSIPSFRNVLVHKHNMGVMAAAPLSMGILTPYDPPEWHPAGDSLQNACLAAKEICKKHNVNIASLAILYAMSHPDIPCTLLGMKDIEQIRTAASLAARLKEVIAQANPTSTHEAILQTILTNDELAALEEIQDRQNGPFAGEEHWTWDGVDGAVKFWSELGVAMDVWQQRQL